MKIGELHRAFTDAAKAFERADAEVNRLRAAMKDSRTPSPAADSALRDIGVRLDSLRPRFRPQGFGSPMGRAFDLLGALEATSAAPTEAQQRTFDHLTVELRENIAQLNELITTRLPDVRAKVNSAVGNVEPIKPPE